MKISTSQLYDSAITQMNRQQSNVAEMQAKLASGKSLVKPSDDAEKDILEIKTFFDTKKGLKPQNYAS